MVTLPVVLSDLTSPIFWVRFISLEQVQVRTSSLVGRLSLVSVSVSVIEQRRMSCVHVFMVTWSL